MYLICVRGIPYPLTESPAGSLAGPQRMVLISDVADTFDQGRYCGLPSYPTPERGKHA